MPAGVFVIIPSFNEGPVLAATIEALLPYGYTIVVVDDGSTDRSEALLRDLPVHYLRHPVNLGQGAALQTGLDYALREGAEIMVLFDADGQHPTDRIKTFLKPVRNGECDVVLGSRFLRPQDEALVPWNKRLLLKTGRVVSGLLTGVRLSDTHNGFRVLSREAARRIRLRENGFAHATEFLDEMRKARLRFREMPSAIRYTEYSLRKGQSIWNSVNIVLDLLLRKVLR